MPRAATAAGGRALRPAAPPRPAAGPGSGPGLPAVAMATPGPSPAAPGETLRVVPSPGAPALTAGVPPVLSGGCGDRLRSAGGGEDPGVKRVGFPEERHQRPQPSPGLFVLTPVVFPGGNWPRDLGTGPFPGSFKPVCQESPADGSGEHGVCEVGVTVPGTPLDISS